MKSEIGLWIDHRQAVMVVVTDTGEETKRIISNLEKHVRFSSGSSEAGSQEDVRDRQFGNHLNSYYDEVIAVIRDADAIQIMPIARFAGERSWGYNPSHIFSVETDHGGPLAFKTQVVKIWFYRRFGE